MVNVTKRGIDSVCTPSNKYNSQIFGSWIRLSIKPTTLIQAPAIYRYQMCQNGLSKPYPIYTPRRFGTICKTNAEVPVWMIPKKTMGLSNGVDKPLSPTKIQRIPRIMTPIGLFIMKRIRLCHWLSCLFIL